MEISEYTTLRRTLSVRCTGQIAKRLYGHVIDKFEKFVTTSRYEQICKILVRCQVFPLYAIIIPPF